MHIILGGTGHVGKAISKELILLGEDVLIVTHDEKKVAEIEAMGAKAEVAEIMDSERLHEIFKKGKSLFFLNPPAPIDSDVTQVELKSVHSILRAIENSGLEKIVAESTYGAQPGNRIGDLGVLYEMEQGIKAIGISFSIIRAAYYMSNWDSYLKSAKSEGKIQAYYPDDFKLPMVSPDDIGKFAPKLILQGEDNKGLHYITGPEDYSPNDVAAAFANDLGKPVGAVEIPEENWYESLINAGFSEKAAESMIAMTKVTLEKEYDLPENPLRGETTLEDYIKNLVEKDTA